jgi:methylmalonyl-CoA/ethylmalonyl-CoA epimerase
MRLNENIKSLANWTQLGFVAPDAKDMMDHLAAVGFGPFKVYTVHSRNWEGVNYRGAPAPEYSLEVCMADFGAWDVEVIVPLPGSGMNIYSEYLDKQPAGGLHHLGTYMTSSEYDAAYTHLESLGYPQIQGGPILGSDRDGRFDYFETDPQYGILLELLDMPEVYGNPDYEYPGP